MDEEKDLRKNRRRSIRTLRRRSGVLPLNLLSLEDDSESVDVEGKFVEENQATFGSIWYESQEPVKERRKRRSNIFGTLPIQAIRENEEESTCIPTVSDEPTSDVKLSGNYKSDHKVEKACNEDEDSELSAGSVSDKCVHTTNESTGLDNHFKYTDSSPSSVTCAFKEKLKDNTIDNLKILENSKILNSVIVECHTPLLIDKEHLDASQGNSSLQTPPEQDMSKTTPSSMSPDFPMSPSGAEYTAMIHNESYVVANGNSATMPGVPDQEASDLSFSDKENSINDNSNVDSCISLQAEKEYSHNVSPGFFSVCKTFAGKVVNFVKTSPSYLTNALLNTSNNSDISASPALKGSVSTPRGVGTIDSNSAVDADETIKKVPNVDGLAEPSRSGNENVFPAEDRKLENSHKSYTSSLIGSGRKNRDRKSFFDTFSAISEELMKDTESNKPVQHQNTNKTVEHKVKCDEGKESLQICDTVKKDDLCEISNELAMPKCVKENVTSDITNINCHSPCVDDNNKKIDNKLYRSESVSETGDWQKLKSKQYESSEEFGSGINNVTNIKENKDKTVGFTSSAQKEIDIHTPEMTEIESYEYQSKNKSSERKRKRRALDVAYIDHNENETNEGSPGKMEKFTSDDVIGHKYNLAPNHTAEDTSIDDKLEVVAAVPNSCSKNSDIASPILSLINVLSSETQPSERSPDENSFEHDSCKKKGRRRAFGFSVSDESRRKTGDENHCIGNGFTEPANSPKPAAQVQDDEHNKNTLNIQGSGDNEISELKFIDENLTVDNKIHSKTMNLINKTEAGDDKKKVKKQKNNRRRSGKFSIVSQYNAINETSETDTVNIGAESECERIVESKLSAGLISVDQNKCDIDNNDDMNIRPAVGNEMPKKRGRRKSADIGTLKSIKESVAEENMNAEVLVTNEAVKKRGRPKKLVNATSLKLTGGDMNEMNNMTREGSVENNVSRKPGRPKSAKSASMINMEHEVESVDNSKPEIDAGNTEPKKRGRRKSADAAALNIKKCGIEESENIENELDDEIHVPKKRGRRKSADAATLKLQILNEDDNVGASDMKRGKKRKLDTTEDIEMLYRNKNYVKPEEKKPWQTIVESPINPTEVFKKNRLQRYIDFEKPSQLKLRRRFQRATKNGWDPKKKEHELNDEFVQMKLARVWSELDEESQTDDLRSKLQNIVETV